MTGCVFARREKAISIASHSCTSPASRGAFFMPQSLSHAAKSFCVNDLLGNNID